MSLKTSSPDLIGVIVDVSNSMRLNWEKKDGKGQPRIETIRDALNKEIKRLQNLPADKNLEKQEASFFCLGMGFQRTMFWNDMQMDYGTEITLNTPSVKKQQTNVVCDILALIDILPTKSEMDDLEDNINNRWNDYAKRVLDEVVLDDDVVSKLLSFVHESLRTTALKKLRGSLLNRLLSILLTSKSMLKNKYIQRYANVLKKKFEKRENDIEATSQKESQRYLDSIHTDAKNIFIKNKDRYREFIESTLQDFVDKQTEILLKLLTLGHPVGKVLDTFQEDEVQNLANTIYGALNKDVEEKIFSSWVLNRGMLKIIEKRIGARIDFPQLKRLTEESIKKLAWDIDLRSFAHNAVSNLFKSTFENKAKSKFSDWIGLAASREVARPLSQITNLLPDVFEHEVYSDDFMFGSTPINQAINLASLRFLDKPFESYRKFLVIISDGEFGSATLRFETDLLKKAGVTVICCYVSDHNVMKKLPVKVSSSWSDGARVMFNISSEINPQDDIAKSFTEEGFLIEPEMKLLFQINYSDRLERILNAVLGSSRKSGT
jgi:hypothetical protein